MKIKPTDTCYICVKQACSSEHAPARSIYFDNALYKQPSLEPHNEGTLEAEVKSFR